MQLDLFADPYNLQQYDKVLLAFSGGKDSLACVLDLIERGVPREKIELHHHLVDGREGSALMDWPVTEAYCKAVAKALGIPIYFSWKVGGFEGEMLRNNSLTQPIAWENLDGSVQQVGGTRGTLSTRMMFPQVSPDLSVRWCSAYLKIDVLARLIANSPRFWGTKVLVVTGERGEESKARSCYAVHEPDRADNRKGKDKRQRLVDHFRPIRDWKEDAVWAIIERWGIRAHPCYYLGWGRCSCRFCIFGNANQFASGKLVDPDGLDALATYEAAFGKTIKRKESIATVADSGTPYEAANDTDLAALAMGTTYNLEIMMGSDWFLPAGAFGESSGPM